MKRKIGILGGTFNPPHLGHLYIAEECRQRRKLDEVWFLPAGDPPHKSTKGLVDGRHRAAMLRALLRGREHYRVESLELRRRGASYTHTTMTELRFAHPDIRIEFIAGADMLAHFPKWYRLKELGDLVDFVLVARAGADLKQLGKHRRLFSAEAWPKLQRNITLLPPVDISSTAIRARLGKGKPVFHLTGDAVANYIEKHSLYR